MNEPERGLIEVGDEISSAAGPVKLHTVTRGKHGILVMGHCEGWGEAKAYMPYELPPIEDQVDNWCGWDARFDTTLPSGKVVGMVIFPYPDSRARSIEEYDAEWAKTLKKRQPEPMQSKPLPVGENVMRVPLSGTKAPVSQAQKDIDELWV